MGMFDYVNFTMPCPNCGAKLSEFQTKDSTCIYVRVEPDRIEHFYEWCNKCDHRIEFARPCRPSRPARKTPLTRKQVEAMGFVLSVTPSEKTKEVNP